MSFFEDASLVMIPSGVKDGKLYSIKPVPEYGSEGVTNGTFNTDLTGWSTDDFSNGSIVQSSGSALITSNGLGTGYPSIWQQVTTVVGKTYKVTANFTNNTTGIWFWKFDNNSPLGNTNRVTFINNDSDSSIDAEFEFTATATLSSISAFAEQGNSGSFNFDNVSVKEVIADPADFTFTRGTDTATRVNSAGIIEKETQNLLLQSNQFDTTWNSYNLSRTAGANDFDGGTNAWTIAKLGSYGLINQSVSNTGVHTFSVYAKAGTLDYIALTTSASPFSTAYFDLQNGVVGSLVNAIDSNIESVGGGWYRCSLTTNVTASGFWRIYPADSDGGLTNANLGNIIIYKSQLEQGLVARTYIETTTAAVYAGITDNLPRLDYSGGASCPSLLLEPQRSNQISNSEYYGASGWTRTRMSITSNAGVSPDGTNNASYFVEDSSNNSHQMESNVVTGTGSITGSVFAKSGTRNEISLRLSGGVCLAYYDLDAGEVISASGGTAIIEDYGNGWYRCILTDSSAAYGSGRLQIRSSLNGSITYQGDGSNSLLIYGAQFEAGSYPTSYIPTMGVSATRSVEAALKTLGASYFPTNGISAFVDFDVTYNSVTNFADLYKLAGSSTQLRLETRTNGGIYIQQGNMVTSGNNFNAYNLCPSTAKKICLTFSPTQVKAYVDGVLINTWDGSYTWDFTDLNIAMQSSTAAYNNTMLYPTALTDSECIALTTI